MIILQLIDFPTTENAFARVYETSMDKKKCNMAGVKLDFQDGSDSSSFTANTLAGDRPDVERACAPETLVFTSPDEALPDDMWEVEFGGAVIHDGVWV